MKEGHSTEPVEDAANHEAARDEKIFS